MIRTLGSNSVSDAKVESSRLLATQQFVVFDGLRNAEPKVIKSVALKLGVVQDGIFDAEVAGVLVSTAFLRIAVANVQLEKKHLRPATKPFFSYSGRSLCIW